MSDKVVLPSLDLPGQKTHWTVITVIGGGVVVLLMGAIFLAVVHKQQVSQETAARAVEARAREAAAQVEKMKLEAIAAAEKAKAAAAAAAAEKARAAAGPVAADDASRAGAADDAAKKKKVHSRPGHKAGGKPTEAKSILPPSESVKKTDANLDALLKGLR
jgi:hypothetical protein